MQRKIQFETPVSIQRYDRVFETILDRRWRKRIKSVCDFGCGDFDLHYYIKPIISLLAIHYIDIDRNKLKRNSFIVEPFLNQLMETRKDKLDVTIFAGSVGDPDFRTFNKDAVVALELIEHLYPDTLDAFPYNIFGFIRPKIAIVTTPNADFNVLFSSNPKRMRHHDHKFEWTRQQFKEWAENIVCRFPDYSVTLSGIGEGPNGTEHLGECSQMALFVRKDILDDTHVLESSKVACFCPDDSECKLKNSDSWSKCKCVCSSCCPIHSLGICTYCSRSTQVSRQQGSRGDVQDVFYGRPYQLIEKVGYYNGPDDRSPEEIIRDEMIERIKQRGKYGGSFYLRDKGRSEIPFSHLLFHPRFCLREEEMSELCTQWGYEVEDCLFQTGEVLPCVIFVPPPPPPPVEQVEEEEVEEEEDYEPPPQQYDEYHELAIKYNPNYLVRDHGWDTDSNFEDQFR